MNSGSPLDDPQSFCRASPRSAYLTDVLTRLVNLWPAERIDELLPWAWTGADSGGGLAA
jgi:transposase